MAEGTAEDRAGARRSPTGAKHLGGGDGPTLIEVEERIMRIDSELEQAVLDFDRMNELAAAAKAEWEAHRDTTIVELVNSGEKGAKDTREALAKDRISRDGVPGEDLYRVHLMTAAAVESKGKFLYALQSRLSALQSLLRGLRQVTGFDG